MFGDFAKVSQNFIHGSDTFWVFKMGHRSQSYLAHFLDTFQHTTPSEPNLPVRGKTDTAKNLLRLPGTPLRSYSLSNSSPCSFDKKL